MERKKVQKREEIEVGMVSTSHPLEETTVGGTSAVGHVARKRRWWLTLLILLGCLLGAFFGWQVLNPGNTTGPTVPGHPLSNPQTHLHTVVLGAQARTLYLGTHYGIFTSSDGGRTWPQARGMLDTMMISTLAVDRYEPANLAVVALPSTPSGGAAGTYFSDDSGKSWHRRQPSGLPEQAYPFRIQAGTAYTGQFYAFYLYAGWFETRNMGQHWKALTSGSLATQQMPALLTFPADAHHLFLGGDQGLFESRDDGAHWRKIAAVQGTVQSLTASQEATPQIFCATDLGFYRWRDGATQIESVASVPQVFSRITTDAAGIRVYALAGHDLWFSANRGTNWERRQHFERGDIVTLLLDTSHPTRLYLGLFAPAKVLSSEDGGKTWRVLTG